MLTSGWSPGSQAHQAGPGHSNAGQPGPGQEAADSEVYSAEPMTGLIRNVESRMSGGPGREAGGQQAWGEGWQGDLSRGFGSGILGVQGLPEELEQAVVNE